MKLNQKVTWNTLGKNYTNPHYQRTGTITEVVAAGKIPATYTDGNYTLNPRDHESYVVTVGNHKYWPRVNALRSVS